jgi:hypothetical protein
MARRIATHRLVLILLLALAPLPASAAERSPSGTIEKAARQAVSLWHVLLDRLVSPWSGQKLGPSIDPNGLNAGPCSGGEGSSGGDLGLSIDPNG